MTIDRALLEIAFPGQPRTQRAFEDQSTVVQQVVDDNLAGISATQALQDATFITLSANATLAGEYVLSLGRGIKADVSAGAIKLSLDTSVPNVVGGFEILLNASGETSLILPLSGTLATLGGVETLYKKTIAAPLLSGVGGYASDALAAAGGVPLGGVYHTAGALKIRLV
jgi:hypothetical protein